MGTRTLAALAVATATLIAPVSPAGAQAPDGKGTAVGSLTGASVVVDTANNATDVSLGLAKVDSSATLDKARLAGATVNHATGALTPVAVTVAGVDAGLPSTSVSRDERNPGEEKPGQDQVLAFTVPNAGMTAEAADTIGDPLVAQLLTDVDGAASSTVPEGFLANGDAALTSVSAVFEAVRAIFSGGTSVASAEALGGLVKLTGLNATGDEASATTDMARAAIPDLSVDSITVLDMNSLLGLLGLEANEIPFATLAYLADALDQAIPPTLGSTSLSGFTSWADVQQTVVTARDGLEDQLALGVLCGLLPGVLNGLLGELQISCSTSVQATLDAVNALSDSLLNALIGAVTGAPLVSVENLTASVQAVAAVNAEGIAETSSQAIGNIGALKIGGENVGAVAADLTKDSLATLQERWNATRAAAVAEVNEVLGVLGTSYQGVVDVIPVTVAVQTTQVEDDPTGPDGDYAIANAKLTLLRVTVSLPVELPAPLDAAVNPPPSATTTTTTLLPIPTTLPTLPTLPIASVRDAGATAYGDATLATTVTVDVGVLSAHAEHTRPGVELTGGGENRTWNARTGFGGPLPRTGASSGTAPMIIFAVLISMALGLARLGRAQVRRVTVS